MITLGDPHLGRRFITGVPPHRRGNREEMQWQDFEKSLHCQNSDMHICMGDLFDSFTVSATVILRAYDIYRRAAKDLSGCTFVILKGNHDASRDTSKASAFDVFTQLVRDISNIIVIDEVTEINNMGFVPYDVFIPVADQVSQLSDDLSEVFMHHDYTDFGGDHVIPTQLLAEKGLYFVTNGHDHVARTEKRHGVTVRMVGSMQPYSHAEDPEGRLYKTVTLDELENLDTKFLNLRVLLADGEELPTDIDCLSIIAKRLAPENVEEANMEEFESFDLRSALADLLDPDIRSEVMEVFNAE